MLDKNIQRGKNIKKNLIIIVLIFVTIVTNACSNNTQMNKEDFYNNVLDNPTNAYFTNEKVDISDLKTMAIAGINSPSAMNSQPWHFTIVNNKQKLEKIGLAMKEMMGKM